MNANDTEVKNVGFGWEAIDIFLFSNGQNCSPPRKYHLRKDELDWWEATLNYLGKSLYGSSNTAIELYKLNGDKIEGPLELSNGMPCVAVVPPDTFTHAGYEKYLMKASRSWEKRKAKNANLTDESEVKKSEATSNTLKLSFETSEDVGVVPRRTACPQLQPELPCSEHFEPCCPCQKNGQDILQKIIEDPERIYATAVNKPEENVATSSVVSQSQNSTHILNIPEVVQLPMGKIALPPTIRNEKKHGTLGTSVVRNFIKPTTNPKASQMKMIVKQNVVKSNEAVSPKFKRISKYLNKSDMSQKATTSNKNFVTDSLPLQDVITHKEVIIIAKDTGLYQNAVPEMKSINLEIFSPSVVDEINDYNILKPSMDDETQTIIELSTSEVNTTPPKCSPQSSSKVKVIPITNASRSNTVSSDIPLEDNCIAIINKGDAVNLKLNIELQNSETSNKNNSNCKNGRKINSLSNIFKKKKFGNDHIGVPPIASMNSLESVIDDINKCYTQVVLVQCSCCGNKTTVPRVDALSIYKDPNGVLTLTPNTVQDVHKCLCCQNHRLSADSKAMSTLCIEELNKTKSSSVYPSVKEVSMVMTVNGTIGSQTDEWQRKVADICIGTKRELQNNVKSFDNDPCCIEKYCTLPYQAIGKMEHVGSTNSLSRSLSYNCVNSYTETEWCNILLEAQLHEDGRYSFHFPPLEVLKRNSMI